jgi:hypothetical protein
MYIGLHVNYPLFLSDFNETWIFSTYFWKIVRCQISRKSVQWEQSCFMRTGGRTDRHDELYIIYTAHLVTAFITTNICTGQNTYAMYINTHEEVNSCFSQFCERALYGKVMGKWTVSSMQQRKEGQLVSIFGLNFDVSHGTDAWEACSVKWNFCNKSTFGPGSGKIRNTSMGQPVAGSCRRIPTAGIQVCEP